MAPAPSTGPEYTTAAGLRYVVLVRGPAYASCLHSSVLWFRLPEAPRFLLPFSGRLISHVPRVTGRCRPAGYRAASELISCLVSTFFVSYSLTAASGLAAEPLCGTGGCTKHRAGRGEWRQVLASTLRTAWIESSRAPSAIISRLPEPGCSGYEHRNGEVPVVCVPCETRPTASLLFRSSGSLHPVVDLLDVSHQ